MSESKTKLFVINGMHLPIHPKMVKVCLLTIQTYKDSKRRLKLNSYANLKQRCIVQNQMDRIKCRIVITFNNLASL